MEIMDYRYDSDVIHALEVIWNYMKLNQSIQPCDIILGCGCSNLDIPVKCAELFKAGYGKKILFSGGAGKVTKDAFQKSEAEVYRDIAIAQGVSSDDILLETKSTNTGDNFRFSKGILECYHTKSVLIVHFPASERRTLATAKRILPSLQLFITSPDLDFNQFITRLQRNVSFFHREVSLLVGDIQRLIIYPQLGWQEKILVPDEVVRVYYFLKSKGFDDYIYSSSDILKLFNDNHISISNANLFT